MIGIHRNSQTNPVSIHSRYHKIINEIESNQEDIPLNGVHLKVLYNLFTRSQAFGRGPPLSLSDRFAIQMKTKQLVEALNAANVVPDNKPEGVVPNEETKQPEDDNQGEVINDDQNEVLLDEEDNQREEDILDRLSNVVVSENDSD